MWYGNETRRESSRALRATLLLCLALGATGAVSASAQELADRVQGHVRDEKGDPVAQAQVFLPELGRGVVTDVRGAFSLGSLEPGRYELRISRIGFAPVRRMVSVDSSGARLEVKLIRTPLSLPGLLVTATPGGRDVLGITQATSQLSGRELEREMGATIAQTLRMQPGVSVRVMGPAATMPVLRGLTGDRVLMLHDGQRSADLAGSADDHGVTIDPLTARRVEVVRGPATLLYGNNALGGVVNVISDDVPTQVPSRPEGSLGVQTESAYPGAAASARSTLPLSSAWALAARLGGRSTGEMRIPDDPVLGDRLDNTAMRNWSGSLGVARRGERSWGGGALRGYQFAYGIPVPPDAAPVSLRGRRYEVSGQAEISAGPARLPSLRVSGALHDYLHDELNDASGQRLQTFALRTWTGSALLRHGRLGSANEGAVGVSALLKDYAATGPEALTPPAGSRGLGAFAFQEVALSGGGVALQMGGRFDHYRIESRSSDKFGAGRDRDFSALSGSVGIRVPLAPAVSGAVHLGRSFRAPTVEELFSGAAHAGTGAVELGNPELRAERGLSAEGVLRAQDPRWNAQVAVYRTEIANFVHLAARGDTLLYGVRLPVLMYAQERAVLQGVEGSLEWAASGTVVVGAMGDLVHAQRADGMPLSYMPPPRLGLSLRWDDGSLTLGGDLHHEFVQNRVGAADERPTPAHTLVRLHAGLRLRSGRQTHSLSIRAENLTNELHREATSRVKDFAPGPGRNLALVYRLYY